MPVMDGYSATECIRAQPQWQDLPIIAMTASAMATDRERVIRCGMNDHIAKPLDLDQMFRTLARWIHPAPVGDGSRVPTAPDAPTAPTPHIDTADGLRRCMGNMDLYRRLLRGFVRTQSDFAAQLARLEPTSTAALSLVHNLKGLAGNIGATGLLQAVTQLELTLHGPAAQDSAAAWEARRQADLAHALSTLDAVLAEADRLQRPSSGVVQQQQAALADQALRAHLGRLARLVGDNDARARELMQDLLHQWPILRQNDQVNSLKQALAIYDFEAAAQALAPLQSAPAAG